MTKPRFLAATIGGLFLAAVTILLGAFLVGMGHGPSTPLMMSIVSIALYPLVLIRLFAKTESYGWLQDIVTILIAIALMFIAAKFSPWAIEPYEIWRLMVFEPLYLIAAFAGFAALSYFASRCDWHLIVGDILFLGIAGGLNFELYQGLSHELFGVPYNELFFIWLAFWLGWQVISLLALIRHLRGAQS
jgi:hypothetical protein